MRAVLVFFLVYRMYFVNIAVYMCPDVKDEGYINIRLYGKGTLKGWISLRKPKFDLLFECFFNLLFIMN